MGWIATAPTHECVRSIGLGFCLTKAIHYKHTRNTSIASQHVPIVALVDRHSPT
jgi:hypothetical protein